MAKSTKEDTLLDKVLKDRTAQDALYSRLSGIAPDRKLTVNGKQFEIITDFEKPSFAERFLTGMRKALLGN